MRQDKQQDQWRHEHDQVDRNIIRGGMNMIRADREMVREDRDRISCNFNMIRQTMT